MGVRSHRRIRIGLVQISMGPDPGVNMSRAVEQVIACAKRGAQVICLPELFRTLYFPAIAGTDTECLAETVPGPSTDAFSAIAREFEAVIIVPVYEKAPDGRFYNTAVIIDADGKVLEPYRKVHIPQDPGFYEKGYFFPGDSFKVAETRFGVFAVLICYDQWFPEAAREVALLGAEIIFYPTAIGHPADPDLSEGSWQDAWELIQRSHAIANSVHVAAVNRVGVEGSLSFFGGSFICDAFGSVITRASDREETVIADIDPASGQEIRDSWGFFQNRRPDTYHEICRPIPAGEPYHSGTPLDAGYHMPAEWEPHEAVWIAWPHDPVTFPNLPLVETAYVQWIAAIHQSEKVELLVHDDLMRERVFALLRLAGVDTGRISFRVTPYADVWIRDYGPTFVINRATSSTAMVKWEFNAWGNKYEDLAQDRVIPDVMNQWLRIPAFLPGIVLEGGSIEVNGRGTVLTTRSCLLNRNRNPTLSETGIEESLKKYLGASTVIWLGNGILGDDTDGHVDDIARFTDPSTVVCAFEYDPDHPNHVPLRENFEVLKRAEDQEGNPLNVVRLPMPHDVCGLEGPYPASYTNFFIGNGIVVVPVFHDPRDEEALSILRELFPGRRVVPVDARAMVEGMGTFHCASQQQPRPSWKGG